MAKMNGKLLLTTKQIDRLKKGRTVRIYREGKTILIGVKFPDKQIAKWRRQIKNLKKKIIERRERSEVPKHKNR